MSTPNTVDINKYTVDRRHWCKPAFKIIRQHDQKTLVVGTSVFNTGILSISAASNISNRHFHAMCNNDSRSIRLNKVLSLDSLRSSFSTLQKKTVPSCLAIGYGPLIKIKVPRHFESRTRNITDMYVSIKTYTACTELEL